MRTFAEGARHGRMDWWPSVACSFSKRFRWSGGRMWRDALASVASERFVSCEADAIGCSLKVHATGEWIGGFP